MTVQELRELASKGVFSFQEYVDHGTRVFRNIKLIVPVKELLEKEKGSRIAKEIALIFHWSEDLGSEEIFFLDFQREVRAQDVLPIAKEILSRGQTISDISKRCYNADGEHNFRVAFTAYVHLKFEEGRNTQKLKVA